MANVNNMNGNEILAMLGQLLERTREIETHAQANYERACNKANGIHDDEAMECNIDARKACPELIDNITAPIVALLNNIGFKQTGNNEYCIKTLDGDGTAPDTCISVKIIRDHSPSVYDSHSERKVRCRTVDGAHELYKAYKARSNARLSLGTTISTQTEKLMHSLSRRKDNYTVD